MHECPCCGDDFIYSDDPAELCRACKKAGCEPTEDEDGEYYASCEIPDCPDCGTRASFMNDERWHDNCEPEDCERVRQEGAVRSWAP